MSEISKGEMPQPGENESIEFSNVAEDIEALGRTVTKLEQSKQPLPKEAKTAYTDLQAAKGDTKKQLEALKLMKTALKGYDPVEEEIVAHDARAYVSRMILQLEKSGE